MGKNWLSRWAVQTIIYLTVSAFLIATLCAFTPIARVALIVGFFAGLFMLPITYYQQDGRMTVKGDAIFAGTITLFIVVASVVSPLACAWFTRHYAISCYRTGTSCLGLLIPCLFVVLLNWVWARLNQRRDEGKIV